MAGGIGKALVYGLVALLLPCAAGQQPPGAGPKPWWEALFLANFDPVPRKAMDALPSAFAMDLLQLEALRTDSVLLYRGIALLKEGKAEAALKPLLRAAGRMNGIVSNNVEWYLALCYLRLNRIESAEYMFHKVAETEVHPFQDEAEVVYQQIMRRH